MLPHLSLLGEEKLWWPESFRKMHKLGLFPLIKRFHVEGMSNVEDHEPTTFSPELFDCHILRQFFSLTNVQELGIDDLDIPAFMPEIRLYFQHFLPTVRSLALTKPRGSRRQVFFFIRLFRHLEDLKLLFNYVQYDGEPPDDPTLVPFFIPPLRGRLMLKHFHWAGMLEDMIGLFGRIRFRHLEFLKVDGVQLLLDACAETLETLRFYPFQPYAESLNLSQNKSLRALELTMSHMTQAAQMSDLVITTSLRDTLSTITSPRFSEVTVVYKEDDFHIVYRSSPPFTFNFREVVLSNDRIVFKMLRKMQEIRDFKLVLCANVRGPPEGSMVQELEWLIDSYGWRGGGVRFLLDHW